LQRDALCLSVIRRANEYELSYSLGFLFLDSQGNVLSKTQPVEITRDYFNDQEELLGKDNEEQVIRKEMYRQAITAMLNRSRIVVGKIAKLTPDK
jgi:LPS-assembly lipoprotein